jgi:hypothetical protein
MIMIKNARLSFPALFEPTAFQDAEPKYSATFLIEKGSDTHKAIAEEIRRVAIDAWGKDAQKIVERQTNSTRNLLRDGDGDDGMTQSGEPKTGYAGNVFIKASNKKAPLVIGRNKQPLDASSGIPYAGCYVNAQIDIWAQDNKFGKFLNCKLLAVQYWADGESFGTSGRADVSAFDSADDDADASAFSSDW